MRQDIDPINDRGSFHGYQEWYNWRNKTLYRGIRKHGLIIGYQEWHGNVVAEFYIR